MVLQRDRPISFWGTAVPGTVFSIAFAGKTKQVTANDVGYWRTVFPALRPGKVYTLNIISDSSFTYSNILIGDVWLASGQSNMEFMFGNTDSVALDLKENTQIRYFSTPTYISNYPQTACRKMDWQLCKRENIPSFSAVAYFFAQRINKETGIPIGIINSSWGGTSIKAWISEKGIAGIPAYKALLDSVMGRRNTANAIDSITSRNNAIAAANNKTIQDLDQGYVRHWQNGYTDTTGWASITLPGNWQNGDLKDFDGVLWFEKEIVLPATIQDEWLCLQFGRTLGLTELYINGIKAGVGNYFRSENRYYIKPNTLLPGNNKVVIRLLEKDPAAAFLAKPTEMLIKTVNADIPAQFSLAGTWRFRSTLSNKEIEQASLKTEPAVPNTTVTSIYNVKINPLLPLPIKGFLWYQGENDAAVAYFYRETFTAMIKDWRRQFNQGDLPFIFAQLPSFGRIKKQPVENSDWAEIRESQAAALSLPNTAMAVTLDLGDPADIHPHNKKPVGERMAYAALNQVYSQKHFPESPLLQSYHTEGNTVRIVFKNAGGGLTTKNAAGPNGFAIAGADKRFVWAHVSIEHKNELVISNDSVAHPLFVRYAWGASPLEANIVNTDQLPAAPFRTDNWTLTTSGKYDN